MKKIILLVLPIVLISLCSYLPDLQLPSLPSQSTQVACIDSGSPDLFLNVETTSTDIKGGRSVEVIFELRNKQDYPLSNVKLKVYDYPCFDVASNYDKFDVCPTCNKKCGSDGTLRANQSCIWSWRWDSETSDADKDCSIKFLVTYEAKNVIYQDIAILPEAEYIQRQETNTLSNIPINSNSAPGPLSVYLTFSESQPFIANEPDYGMYINYNNVGNGFFGDLKDKIKLTAPNNIKDLSCNDYDNSTLTLSKTLDFINGRAVPTNCVFNTLPEPTLNIMPLSIDVDYTYTLYNSISITVRGTGIPSG